MALRHVRGTKEEELTMATAQSERRGLLRFGIGLECVSIAWMLVEGGVGIASGIAAHSLALEAFGIDSLLELVSAGVVLWWLLLTARGADPERTHNANERAERIVGSGLLLLAVYVLIGAIFQLAQHSAPASSVPGLILAVVAAVVMPVLFLLKRRNAERLDSDAMRGDAYESLTCGWMAWALLVGLALRRLFGWWWADPVTALVLVPLLVREGWEGIHEWFQ